MSQDLDRDKAWAGWYNDKTVLLTGATAGIGREMARILADCAGKLLLCGRDPAAMRSLRSELPSAAGQRMEEYLVDLSDPAAVRELCRCVQTHHQVDVLINNAGFGFMGDFETMPTETLRAMHSVNMLAVSELCRAFLPGLKDRPGSGILNVGSVASFFPTPGSALYGATKHFILGLTDALHQELSASGVHVSGLYPGKTHSRFLERASRGQERDWQQAMPAAMVAEQGLAGLARNQLRVIPGRGNQIKVLLARVLPVGLLLKKAAAANRSSDSEGGTARV